MSSKAVVVLSGGLDSSTLAHHVAAEGWDIYGISFNYGQRHAKELEFARLQLDWLGAKDHKVVDATFLRGLFQDSGSSLVTGTDVPEGHYAEETMKATVVPNRNMIMSSIAAGYAISIGADKLAMGVHAGDHFVYPDCRPDFFAYLSYAIKFGNQGFASQAFHIDTPFIYLSKNDIALRAYDLGVDIASTWSCYKGGEIHCGKCGTCVERREALESVKTTYPNFEDPTEYIDRHYWKTVIKNA